MEGTSQSTKRATNSDVVNPGARKQTSKIDDISPLKLNFLKKKSEREQTLKEIDKEY